jgi:hypothetical protein
MHPYALAELKTSIEITEMRELQEMVESFDPMTVCGMPSLSATQAVVFRDMLLAATTVVPNVD